MRSLILGMLITFAIASCQSEGDRGTVDAAAVPSPKPSDCRTIQHAMGETEICGQPQRIVALGPYVLEPLLALEIEPVGYGDHIAFHLEDYSNPSQQIPYLGDRITQPIANVGTAYTPSMEAIVKTQPDLILATEGNISQYETLSAIAPTLALDYADIEGSFRAIAKAVNRSQKADRLLAETERNIAAARESFAPLVATYPKLLLLGSSQLQQINIEHSGGPCSSFIQKLGFQLVFLPGMEEPDPNSSIPVSLETLPQLNEADLIVLLGHNFDNLNSIENMDRFEEHQLSNLKQAWENNAIAQSLDASKAGRVYFISTYLCRGLPGAIGTELYLEALKEQLLSEE